jgi:hypothetical protein
LSESLVGDEGELFSESDFLSAVCVYRFSFFPLASTTHGTLPAACFSQYIWGYFLIHVD